MPKPTNDIRKWSGGPALTESSIRHLLHTEGFKPVAWFGLPGKVYAMPTLSHHLVIWVAEGSITFNLLNSGQQITLHKGDRLDLPPNVPYQARAGPEEVVCLEAHWSDQA